MPKALYFSDQDKTWGSEVKVVYVDAEGAETEVALSYSDLGYFYSGEVPEGTVSFYFTDGENETAPKTIEAVLDDGCDMCVIFDDTEEWMEFAIWEQMNPEDPEDVENPVAQTGGIQYTSIQAAVNAAQNGDTITVIDNIALTTADCILNEDGYSVLVNVAGMSVTIDLNGKAITVNAKAADLATAKNNWLMGVFCADTNGKLTLKDSVGTGSVSVTANEATVYSRHHYRW